jgi:hypothetical protein
MASNAPGEMAIRTMRPIWERPAPVASRHLHAGYALTEGRRLRPTNATRTKPKSIMAHVEGSGAEADANVTSPLALSDSKPPVVAMSAIASPNGVAVTEKPSWNESRRPVFRT